ncbi:M28 family peptidase [Methanococcoides orientis]|uniref:M28 family peptidase n=1 Tax=Methanococcoides orientis TaxID=2822137 RepID=UPI001E62BC44|nr:M28 family peptidase [Methanococcoides orientis]UGV41476.1 M28 family peptidase [Methanococcoides orientis]
MKFNIRTENEEYSEKAKVYLNALCDVKPTRSTGSAGNREATDFFARIVSPYGYAVESESFSCMDFESGESSLRAIDRSFEIYPSPFSLGCDVEAELETVTTVEELEKCNCRGKILLMKGKICDEPLMPKNFVFYNPEDHKKIYSLLETKEPAAIVTATEIKPELVGAIYPYPLIEDGDFDIPSAYCTDDVGDEIAKGTGGMFKLRINSKRIPSTACNVIVRKNPDADKKIVICAHIDSRASTPGASDNASGTVVLLLLAEMLSDHQSNICIEIVAFNGEDHYSVAGQMDYLHKYQKEFDKIILAINIDDVGYKKGKTAYSFYECSDKTKRNICGTLSNYKGLTEGGPWYSGDHMIFAQNSIETMALTSECIPFLMKTITHTEKDIPDIIDCDKLVEVAAALKDIVENCD